MRHDPLITKPLDIGTPEARLTNLLLEAQGLQLLSHKFAMLCLAVGTVDTDKHLRDIRRTLRQLNLSWRRLSRADAELLDGFDPVLSDIMIDAFTAEVNDTFECFNHMAHHISGMLLHRDDLLGSELGELVRFVSDELFVAIGKIVAAAQTVSEIGENDAHMRALTDPLTGLPNRRALHQFFQQSEADGWPQDTANVFQVDLDKFKQINDGLGHAAGDVALKHAAQAMMGHFDTSAFVARVGGDEFVIITFGETTQEDLSRQADAVIKGITAPFTYQGKTCFVGGSIGVASGKQSSGMTLARCLTNADLALFSAKNDGRGRYEFFTPNLRSQFEEVEELQSQIRDGLSAGAFTSYFQPQVEGRSGKIVGLEALVRWEHPKRGLMLPLQFLDAAAQGGLLDQLDRYLMGKTFATMAAWRDAGVMVPQVSINLTASRLMEAALVDDMLDAAAQSDVDPGLIGVEILESVMIENGSKQMIDNIQNLSDAGFKVELDDFGTGHASISNLRNFKVDRIKIDRSFVKDVHLYSELAKITSAMIGLAHSLRVDALAEGVETPEERLVLNALGCDHIQGFGVAKPLPASEVEAWLARTQCARKLPPRRGHAQAAIAS